MAHLPFFQFFPADWLQDTRVLSLEARGAWIDFLCAMWIAPERGKLEWTQDQLEHFLGLDSFESTEIWNELIASGVGEFEFHEGPPTPSGPGLPKSRHSTNCVTVMSRRMYREDRERNQGRERVKRHRNANVTQKKRRIYQKSYIRSHISDLNPDDFLKKENPNSSASPTPSVGLKTSDKKTREERFMASMNLIPELKKETDRLYGSDPVKFKRLAAWVAQGRKYRHLETDMAEALRQFWDYRAIDDWYPYLDKLLDKVEKDRGAAESDREHERLKRETEELGRTARSSGPVLSVVRGLSDAKKA